MTTFEASLLSDMQDGICKAGGVFYQYRPCRRNAETIYDIENIRHGVVYAQTPLNMNDPFDSMIGFSAEEFYEDCIDQLVNAINLTDPVQRAVITMLLRYKALGKMAETIQFLDNIANYLFTRKKAMHLTHLSSEEFINRHLSTLYSKCPKDIKKQFSIQEFYIYAKIVSRMDRVPITAKNLSNMYSLDSALEQLYKQTIELRDTKYIPNIRKVLSQLTVSCFSASGWDNQLMWSHYANSYSGICIEYDFSKIQGFKGFIYPVEYSSHRPTLKMRDLGIDLINRDGQVRVDHRDIDIRAILSYMLVKNNCWSYEDEWRIINIGEEEKPMFIDLPHIKSITLGLGIESICKQLLWDVCKERGIPCYQLQISTDSYQLNRYQLTETDFEYNGEQEVAYLQLLCQHFNNISSHVAEISELIPNPTKDTEHHDFSAMPAVLSDALDLIADSHYIKLSLNRVCTHSEDEISSTGIPDNIIGMVTAINGFIENMTTSVEQIKESIPNLLLGDLISRTDYWSAKKLLFNINESIERFKTIEWNTHLFVPINQKNPPKLSACPDEDR